MFSDYAQGWHSMFRVAASQGALLLAGGEKGMRHAMPNACIMIHQPHSGCGVWIEACTFLGNIGIGTDTVWRYNNS